MNIIIIWKISTDLDVWQHKHSYLIPWMIKLKLSAYFPTKPSYWLTGLQFALSIVLVCVHLAGSLGGAVTDFTAGGLECSSLGGGWISTTNLCTTQKSLYSTGGLLSEGAEPVWPPPRGAGHHRSHVRCGEWVGGQPTPHSGLFCCVLFYHKMYHFYLKINLLASTPHKGEEAHLKKRKIWDLIVVKIKWPNCTHEINDINKGLLRSISYVFSLSTPPEDLFKGSFMFLDCKCHQKETVKVGCMYNINSVYFLLFI